MPIKSPKPHHVPVHAAVLSGPPVLSVPFWEQVGDNWCWAASLQMVLDYYQQSVQQCEMANLLLQLPVDCCGWPVPSWDCDQKCDVVDVAWLYGQYGLVCTPVGAVPDHADLVQEITEQRPVEVALKRDSKSGHAVVLRWAGTDAGVPSVLVNDPLQGANTSFSYQGMIDTGATESWIGIG